MVGSRLDRCHSVQCPPQKCPPGHYSLVKIVPLGYYSLVNNVPPQWILSPLEQGWEPFSAGIQALRGGKIVTSRWEDSSFWNKQVIWSGLTSHTGQRGYGVYGVLAHKVLTQFMQCILDLPWPFLPKRLSLAGKEAWRVSVSSAASMNDKRWWRRPEYEAKHI